MKNFETLLIQQLENMLLQRHLVFDYKNSLIKLYSNLFQKSVFICQIFSKNLNVFNINLTVSKLIKFLSGGKNGRIQILLKISIIDPLIKCINEFLKLCR